MNLPRVSVQRPIFTTMVTLMVVVLGVVSLSRLRIDLLPNIELPTVKNHVHNILRKVGASRRGEAAALLRRDALL